MNEHVLGSSVTTSRWGRLPARDAVPVAEVASGDVITIDTLSHEGLLEDQGRDPVAFFGGFGVGPDDVLPDAVALARHGVRDPARDGPHVVTGPIAVAGARLGDVVEVEFLALDRRVDYGIVSNRHGLGALPGELPEAGADGAVPEAVFRFATAHGTTGRMAAPSGAVARFPLAPFLGLVGVAVDADAEPSSVPPGAHGGNLDIRHLGVATRLFLPVQVDEAGVYVGDPHFSQGDGEVALTAFEASLRATLRITLHREAAAGWTGPPGRRRRALDRPGAARGPRRGRPHRHPPCARPPRAARLRSGDGPGLPERGRRPAREPGGRPRAGRPPPDPQGGSGR